MQKLYIVSHTHWDREWYEPFQVYRARLIRCVDNLINIFATDPDYKYFLLDGQTIILEDYLEVRPERETILRALVQSGRLQIGPWYVLPDEFLVSGEALLRNLARGLRTARDFGDTQPIGYIPDPFGHISQMPQILRGLGIGAAVFRRGLADEPNEVAWQAPNGSQVLACYLREGYDNAAWLGHDDASFVRNLDQARRALAPHALTPNLLFMNGNDHMEPWPDLPRLLQAARQQPGEVEIIHASLSQFVSQVQNDLAGRAQKLDVVQGELRNPKRHHLLPGVLSTRMWIKQRNARAQLLLEKWAEPFAAFANLELEQAANLRPSTFDLISLAWKYLLYNHPHDSICGCGIDQTHAEMGLRFDWVEQIITPIIDESLAHLAAQVDTRSAAENALSATSSVTTLSSVAQSIVVFNAGAGPRTDLVTAQVELPDAWENLAVADQSGAAAPFQVKNRRSEAYYHKQAPGAALDGLLGMVESGRIRGMAIQNVAIFAAETPIRVDVTLIRQGEPNPALPQWQQQLRRLAAENPLALFEIHGHSPTQLELDFIARDVPGYGYKTFAITQADQPAPEPAASPQTFILENEFYRLEPDSTDGSLTVTDKTTGQRYLGLNRFLDGGDRGDLYNYCPPENDRLICEPAAPPQITCERTTVRQTLRIALEYRLPVGLTAERTGRTPETVTAHLETLASLVPGVRRIDFQTQVNNPVRDHRLQVEFPTPIDSDHVEAEQAFDVVRRSIAIPQDTAGWIEQPRPEAPLQNFVSVSDGKTGLTLVTRGLPEYQAQQESQGVTLRLTLLRCIGWLSRDDLSTRLGHAGPALETPGAQEIGPHEFEYALIPASGDWRNAITEAHAFIAPMRASAASLHPGALPPAASFVEVSSHEFIISAIKPSIDGSGLIVRGYNLSDQPQTVTLRLSQPFTRAARLNLDETELESLPLRDERKLSLNVKSREIITLKFAL